MIGPLLKKTQQSMSFYKVGFLLTLVAIKCASGQYGGSCTDDEECKGDFRDPMMCIPPLTPTTIPPTTTEPSTTTKPPTTTEPSTTEPTTTEPSTTTDSPTPSTETPPGNGYDELTANEVYDDGFLDVWSISSEVNEDDTLSEYVDYNFLHEDTHDTFDKMHWLANPGTCGCQEGMFRHPELNRCVSPELGECHPPDYTGDLLKTCTKFADCFKNPDSNSPILGSCHCVTDALSDPHTGHCKLQHGSNLCKADKDCDTRKQLACQEGTCVCRFEHMRWNQLNQTCGFLVGESCTPRTSPWAPAPVCVDNAECDSTTTKCKCLEGFQETPDKECKHPHNGECNSDSDCLPPLVCSGNACSCPEGQRYFESTGNCHLPEGSLCDAVADHCVLRSTCINQTCVCDSGYDASDHACHARYGSSCSEEVPCHTGSFLGECPEGDSSTCGCQEGFRYHNSNDRCVGNIDEACNNDDYNCIDHAVCHENKCVCGGNFIPGTDKAACYTRYGESCKDMDCFPGHHLGCSEFQNCTCGNLEDQVHDEQKGYCVARVGRECLGSANGIECVQHATCSVEGSKTVCRCEPTFTSSKSGLCVPKRSGSGTKTSVGAWTVLFFMIPLTMTNFVEL